MISVYEDRFPGGPEVHLLFNSDIVNSLLKTTGGETRPAFVIVVWSALITGGWVVVV